MIEREYQYLISGLPAISMGEKMWTTIEAFRKQLEAHLHPEDFEQVRLILLQKDHDHLLHFLETGELTTVGAGNFTQEDFSEPGDRMPGADPGKMVMPEYMSAILTAARDEKLPVEKSRLQRELDEGFFRYIMEDGNDFLRKYFTFQFDLNNLLTFIRTGEHQLDQRQDITGNTSHALHLMEYAGRSLVKDPEFAYFDEIVSLAGNPSIAAQERNIDLLRWSVIEDMNLFEYFSIDRILGYLLQMLIAERWSLLDDAAGEKKLRRMIDVSYRKIMEQQLLKQDS